MAIRSYDVMLLFRIYHHTERLNAFEKIRATSSEVLKPAKSISKSAKSVSKSAKYVSKLAKTAIFGAWCMVF